MPASSFINVDLPAPFSPTSASTSPCRRSIPTSDSACTPGNLLLACSICNSGGAAITAPPRAGGADTGGPTAPALDVDVAAQMHPDSQLGEECGLRPQRVVGRLRVGPVDHVQVVRLVPGHELVPAHAVQDRVHD